MKCPRCQVDVSKDAIHVSDSHGYPCAGCQGIWLQGGALHERLVALSQDGSATLDSRDERVGHALRRQISPSAGDGLSCPECADSLKPMHLKDVEIDVCQKCEGVWLDDTERQELRDMFLKFDEGMKSYYRFKPSWMSQKDYEQLATVLLDVLLTGLS